MSERDWESGYRAANASMLAHLLGNLGSSREVSKHAWRIERMRAINALRSICEDHGDNDWDEYLDLADIIEKHLRRHLEK